MHTGSGVRLSKNGKLVERITLKIKIFDTGKWEWTVRQRYIKEPRVKLNDMLSILDEVKAEIQATDGKDTKKDDMAPQDMQPTTQP
jgi:hypothetical protein